MPRDEVQRALKSTDALTSSMPNLGSDVWWKSAQAPSSPVSLALSSLLLKPSISENPPAWRN